jgi:hypothetical protein
MTCITSNALSRVQLIYCLDFVMVFMYGADPVELPAASATNKQKHAPLRAFPLPNCRHGVPSVRCQARVKSILQA